MLERAITNTLEMQVKSIFKEMELLKKQEMETLRLKNKTELLEHHLIYSVTEWM